MRNIGAGEHDGEGAAFGDDGVVEIAFGPGGDKAGGVAPGGLKVPATLGVGRDGEVGFEGGENGFVGELKFAPGGGVSGGVLKGGAKLGFRGRRCRRHGRALCKYQTS